MLKLLPILMVFFCLTASAADVEIHHATVRQPLPGRDVSAGYFSITNHTTRPLSIIEATSPWFGKIELHQHVVVDGMMRMQQVTAIDVAPQQTIHLQPGGLHLMMFNPKQTLPLGAQLPLELKTSDGKIFQVAAIITRIPKQ